MASGMQFKGASHLMASDKRLIAAMRLHTKRKDIADALGCTVRTVSNNMTILREKLCRMRVHYAWRQHKAKSKRSRSSAGRIPYA